MKISSSKLDIPGGNLTAIKFLKDPSARGNSPNFSKTKMKMKSIPLSIKPVNKGSWIRNLFNPTNLVNSIGIGPKDKKKIKGQNSIILNLKSCCLLR